MPQGRPQLPLSFAEQQQILQLRQKEGVGAETISNRLHISPDRIRRFLTEIEPKPAPPPKPHNTIAENARWWRQKRPWPAAMSFDDSAAASAAEPYLVLKRPSATIEARSRTGCSALMCTDSPLAGV